MCPTLKFSKVRTTNILFGRNKFSRLLLNSLHFPPSYISVYSSSLLCGDTYNLIKYTDILVSGDALNWERERYYADFENEINCIVIFRLCNRSNFKLTNLNRYTSLKCNIITCGELWLTDSENHYHAVAHRNFYLVLNLLAVVHRLTTRGISPRSAALLFIAIVTHYPSFRKLFPGTFRR